MSVQYYKDRYRNGLKRNLEYTLEVLKRADTGKTEIDRERQAILQSIWESLASSMDEEKATEAMFLLADYMWQAGLWADWELFIEKGMQHARENEKTEVETRFMVIQAGLNQALGNWKKAVKLANEALYRRRHTSQEVTAQALYYRGAALHDLGRLRKSRRDLCDALKLANKKLEGWVKLILSRVLRKLGHLQEAEQYRHEALEWAERRDFRWFAAEIYLERASQVSIHDPIEAMRYTRKSEEIYLEYGFNRGLGYVALQKARIAAQEDLLGISRKRLNEARLHFEKTNYLPGLAHVAYALAQVLLTEGRDREAAVQLRLSLRYADQVNYYSAQNRALRQLLTVAVRLQKVKEIFQCLLRMAVLKFSRII